MSAAPAYQVSKCAPSRMYSSEVPLRLPTTLRPVAGASALVGLLAYEHAYVQAGQAVPLA